MLGINLGAVCVPQMGQVATAASGFNQSQVSFIELGTSPAHQPSARAALLDKVKGEIDLAPLLEGV